MIEVIGTSVLWLVCAIVISFGIQKLMWISLYDTGTWIPFGIHSTYWRRIVVVLSALEILIGLAIVSGLLSKLSSVVVFSVFMIVVTSYGVISVYRTGNCGCGFVGKVGIGGFISRNAILTSAGVWSIYTGLSMHSLSNVGLGTNQGVVASLCLVPPIIVVAQFFRSRFATKKMLRN